MLAGFIVEVLKVGITALVTSMGSGIGNNIADALKPRQASTPAANALSADLDMLKAGSSLEKTIADTQRSMAALLNERPSYGFQVASAVQQFSPQDYTTELDALIAGMQQKTETLRSFELPNSLRYTGTPPFEPAFPVSPPPSTFDMSSWAYRPPVFAGAFTEASTPPPAPTGGLGPDSTLTIPSSSTPDLDAALEQLRGLSVYETLDEVLKKAGMPPLGS